MASLNLSLHYCEGLKPHNSKLNIPLCYIANQACSVKQQCSPLLLIKCQLHETTTTNLTMSNGGVPFTINNSPLPRRIPPVVNYDKLEIFSSHLLFLLWSKVLWDVGRCVLRLPGTIWGLIQGNEKTIKEIEGEVKEIAEKVKDMAGKVDKVAKDVEKVAECVEEDAEKVETMVDKFEKKRHKFEEEVEEANNSLKDMENLIKKSPKELKQQDNKTIDSSSTFIFVPQFS